jgi:[acyl-carrier-protein] S-malonyltransferase
MVQPEHGKLAVAFPGVGVKLCGHELEFYSRHRALFDRFFLEAGNAAGADLARELAAGSFGHSDRRIDHVFTYAFSCGMYRLCAGDGIAPDLMAGYSFGIYAALYASGALSFGEGLAALDEACRLMGQACAGRDYTMAITIGLSAGEIDAILSDGSYDQLCMVNSNNDTCKVFAGPRRSLETFVTEARRHEAIEARLLNVSVPYHHPRLLEGVSTAFHAFLKLLHWHQPSCPIVSTIDQGLLTTADELLDFTARNLAAPLNWQRVVSALHRAGVVRVVECGAGISLAQNGRFMPFHLEYVTVKNVLRKLGE